MLNTTRDNPRLYPDNTYADCHRCILARPPTVDRDEVVKWILIPFGLIGNTWNATCRASHRIGIRVIDDTENY